MPNLISKILSKTHHSRNPSPGPSLSSPGSQLPKSADLASSSASSERAAVVNAIYYPNWSVYRPLPPSALDLCCVTHILYAFVWPSAPGALESSDKYADDEIAVDNVKGGLAALAQVKRTHAHIKLLLSVGGGGRGSQHFAAASRDLRAREALCAAMRALVDTHGFDGVDLDWEHPSSADDKAAYLALVRELRRALPTWDSNTKKGYLVTAAIPAPQSLLQHYPLGKMSDELDLVFVMAYDFSGPWTEVSGHHAALFDGAGGGSSSGVSGSDAVTYLKSKGVPLRKCVLGIPVYGRFFPGAGSVGKPYDKPKTEEQATVEYCALPQPNAMEWVDESRVAAYCVGTDGFTSYDNPRTVGTKARWAKEKGLAGLFYWTALSDRPGEKSLVSAGWEALR